MITDVLRRNNVRVIGDGPQTMILAHGFGTDQTAWHFQIAAFEARYRMVLFDLVGAGGSEPTAFSPTQYQTLDAYARDLLEICAALDLRDALYVGHSMSGMIGVLAAVAEPHRFARLILIGASPRYLNDEGYHGGFEQTDINQIYAAMDSDYATWASAFAPVVMSNAERPALAIAFANTLQTIDPPTARTVARTIFQSDYRAVLPQVQTRTLIIQPRHDVAVPLAVGEYLAQHMPHATLCVIEAEGHLPHVSAPALVNQAIGDYLAQPVQQQRVG
jgi:sigma-B regulation protein RsbQ